MNELKDIAYRAYCGTSFYPEKRAASILKELEEELQEDLAELDGPGNYREKYIAHARDWLGKKSRVMSSMITGPANFPVNRNRKALSSEDRSWEEFRKWRLRYIKAVNRVHTLSPEDDLDLAIKTVDRLIINQDIMKTANRIIRQKDKTDKQKIDEMMDAGLPESLACKSIVPNCMNTIGFASYTLTNNNAKIKAAKQKVLTMKARIFIKENFEPISFDGGVINIEADRVTITHDEKPERDVIDKIKSRGFHWSRNYSCWSRKHTAQALIDAKGIVGIC